MKFLHKTILVLIISILLISSVYIVFFTKTKQTENNNTNDNSNNQNNSNDNNDNNNNNQDFTHIVLVEEATATWCSNCPIAADVLHKKFNSSGEPDFYYVSMVDDKNTKAHNRLYNDYNIVGFPTVFMDGGYGVIVGSSDFENNFNKKLSEAKNRQTPKLIINLKTKWNETRKEITATATIENSETTTYKGHIKVYVTEINSPWSDWNGNPYHFAFIDYAIDENIEIQSNKNQTITKIWNAGTNIYPENLWIVATVFSQKSTKEYSDPPDNKQQFNAYYADATTATRVVKGSLPPTIGIIYPKYGMRYINEKEKTRLFAGGLLFSKEKLILLKAKIAVLLGNNEPYRKLYQEGRLDDTDFKANIFGKITIKTKITSEAGVEKVEFIIKGGFRQIKHIDTEEPYEFTWDTFAFGRYTIQAKIYDKEGKTAMESIEVLAFII